MIATYSLEKREGENAVGPSGITFTIGPEGKAVTVVVENLNVRGDVQAPELRATDVTIERPNKKSKKSITAKVDC
jgi:hypothetical protein